MGLIRVIFDALYSAVKSTMLWCLVWFACFFVSAVIMELLDAKHEPLTMSALSITFAVSAGHATKLISYFFGCDTEFQNLFSRNREPETDATDRFWRFVVSSFFLGTALTFLYLKIEEASENSLVVSSAFGLYSATFWHVILALVFTQLVFSWPKSEKGEIDGAT